MVRLFLCLALVWGFAAHAAEVRIKDLVEFDGVRGNDLIGYRANSTVVSTRLNVFLCPSASLPSAWRGPSL